MALSFIRKVFSFGRKTAEDQPAETPSAPETVAETPPPLPAPAQSTEPDEPETAPDDGEAPHSAATADPVATEARDHTVEPSLAPAGDAGEPEPREEPEIEADAGQDEAPAPEADGDLEEADRPTDSPEPAVSPEREAADVPQPITSPPVEEAQAETSEVADPDAGEPEEIPAEPEVEPATTDALSQPAAEDPSQSAPQPEPRTEASVGDAPPSPIPSQVRVGKVVSREEAPAPAPAAPEPQRNWWQRLRAGLARSSAQLTDQVAGIFTKRKLDEDTLQELEDVLIQADLGVETALRITDALAAGRYGRDISSAEVARVMAGEIEKVLAPVARPLELDLSHKPHVILVVGVNGTGKTTTIGKLAAKLAAGGLKVTLAAGDTFRAAAIEQLKIWGERTGAEVISTKLGADAAGLAYEALERARENGSDVLIIDTAGRLQNRTELMDELAKVVRVIGKLDPEAPHTVLQTLDATTGQNALNQVEIFRNVAGVNGLVMTKLDGTARGGILVAIAAKHKLPVYFIGVGEGVDDLEPFEASEFAEAIVGETK